MTGIPINNKFGPNQIVGDIIFRRYVGMKVITRLLSLLVSTGLLLVGCGGGSGATATQTSAGTTVSMVSVKSIFSGTAAAGTQAAFTLSGTYLQGNAYTGSFSVISDGATTFENQNVSKKRVHYRHSHVLQLAFQRLAF
jgi:hypothetical protein